MRWWFYERWVRLKRWWTKDSFIGITVQDREGRAFLVVGRLSDEELAIRQVGAFGVTGSVSMSLRPPYTMKEIAGFGNVER